MAENEEQKQPVATSHQEVKITIIRKTHKRTQSNQNYTNTGNITNRNYGKKKRIRTRNYFRRG